MAGAGAARLRLLDLGKCAIGDDGARALALSESMSALECLNVAWNEITDAGALAIARSPHFGRIRWVNVRDNPLTETGKSALRDRFGGAVLAD